MGHAPVHALERPAEASGEWTAAPAVARSIVLSIVIVHWRDRERLRRGLLALAAALERPVTAVGGARASEVEVVVVDNASAEGVQDLVRTVIPRARTLRLETNRGFAGGANAGIAATRGDWVATLNDDVRVEPDWLETMTRAAAEADARCGMLQSRMLTEEASPRVDSTGVVVTRGGDIRDRDRGDPAEDLRPAGEVFCPSAGAALYRRAMLQAIARAEGVFDPDYFLYFEDVDLGWRARLAGWTGRYVPEAIVRHAGQGSAAGHGQGFVRRQGASNRVRVLVANGSATCLLRAAPRLIRDLVWLTCHQGPRAWGAWGRALRGGLAARRALPAEARARRAAVEAEWLATDG